MVVVEDESISINENNYLSKLRHYAIQMSHPSYHVHEADFIGRLESFDLDGRKLYLALGLKTPDKVPHLRSSPTRDYRDYFDDASRSRAEQIFA